MKSLSEQRLEDVIHLLAYGDPFVAMDMRERLEAARTDPEDPLAVQLAVSVREQIRMQQLEELGQNLVAKLRQERSKPPQSLTAELAPIVTDVTRKELRQAMPALMRSLRLHTAVLAVSGLFALMLIGAGAGYVAGRQETAHVAAEWSDLAASPQGAAWLRLHEENPHLPQWVNDACQPGAPTRADSENGPTCQVTLWADAPMPAPSRPWLASLTAHPAFTWFLLLCGVAFGGFIALALGRSAQRPF